MSIWSNKGELGVRDIRQDRIAAGTLGGQHVVPAGLSDRTLSSIIDDADPRIGYGTTIAGGVNNLTYTSSDVLAANNTQTIIGGLVTGGTPGDAAQFHFVGTTIGVLAGCTPDSGIMQVFIDGVLTPGRVSTTASLHVPSNGPNSPAILASDSSIVLTSTGASAFPAGGGTIQVGTEIINYASKTGVTLNGLTRGANGTVAQDHYTYETVYYYGSSIDLSSSTGVYASKKLVYFNNQLSPGQHTITIISQTGATGFARIYFDGFVTGGLIGSSNIFTQTDTVQFSFTTDGNGYADLGTIVPNSASVTQLAIMGYSSPQVESNHALKLPVVGMMYNADATPHLYVTSGTASTSYTLNISYLYLGQTI